jgi:hypothetical protein
MTIRVEFDLASREENPGSDETISDVPMKPFSGACEASRKQTPAITRRQIRPGSTMLGTILNSIYRKFVRSSLSGMRKFAARLGRSAGTRTESY